MLTQDAGRFIRFPLRALAAAVCAALCLASAASTTATAQPEGASAPGEAGLTPFASSDELRKFLRKVRTETVLAPPPVAMTVPAPPAEPPSPSAPPAPAVMADAASAEAIVTTGSRVASPNITNTQEADVDEGGIVKIRGDILVILRRGRLFTISLAGGSMRSVDSINAFPPGVSGEGDWYDEMLVSGDRVVVVGYSYARGGTEINRFRLDPAGRLRWEDAYDLRSNDYYSSRNYASRLVGNRLIFYTPLDLEWEDDPLDALPGLRRWQGERTAKRFTRIASPQRIYIPPLLRRRGAVIDTLHSVTTCDLAAAVLECSAIGVLGPESRSFYVSREAVYLWISDAWEEERPSGAASAFVYRLPFGTGGRPSAIGARGAPVDQFSFREDRNEGVLNVLLRSEGGDDAMWRPEVSEGDVALLRLPLREFGNGSREARLSHYRPLPRPVGRSWDFHNRFAGPYILYGSGAAGDPGAGGELIAAPLTGAPPVRLRLSHAVDRIDLLGRDGIVVGAGRSGLGFTTIELPPSGRPRTGDVFTLPGAAEGENRSHAFFFSPDPGTPDGASGMLGLPVTRAADPAYGRFVGNAAAMLFLRRAERRLSAAGELEARLQGLRDDACSASCVDWYGNARPIFLGPRTFALLGYELVEGAFPGRGRIREVARLDFAPRTGQQRR